jgi:hypothetical protein
LSGTSVYPARSTCPTSRLISFLWSSSERVRVGSAWTCVEAVDSGDVRADQRDPAILDDDVGFLGCARPARIAFTSQPSSARPASNFSSMK